jgi:Putative Na+/H+ antiporter
MTSPTTLQILAAVLFGVAVLHTFSTSFFEHLAHTQPRHAGLWHLLGEVEVVFGFWAMVLVVAMFTLEGKTTATDYLDSRNYTEPLFVFVIMVIAGTRAVLQFASALVRGLARALPLPSGLALYFLVLSLVPLLGSFITEPAAMTLAALMLRDVVFAQETPRTFRYATLGVLFVNISIGGTLTPYAAPPVLMVAGPWGWDLTYMLTHFGWKAALAVLVNAAAVSLIFRKTLAAHVSAPTPAATDKDTTVPWSVVLVHLLFLFGVVVFAHHAAVFVGLFLFFLGYATAYERHQDRLILREGLLVAFFLGGLVVLGGQQQWWLQPLLMGMDSGTVFLGTTALTAITDNAALTYLGSLVEGLSSEFKQALVAGAVTGGGLTVIANAPNPAGVSILRSKFEGQSVQALGLLLAALPPTLVAAVALHWL